MDYTAHVTGNHHITDVSLSPWTPWMPVDSSPPPGIPPPGGVWEYRKRVYVYRHTWTVYDEQHYCWRVPSTSRSGAPRPRHGDDYPSSVEGYDHVTCNAAYQNCPDLRHHPYRPSGQNGMSETIAKTHEEYRIGYPLVVDAHLVQLVARRGVVLRVGALPPQDVPENLQILVDGRAMESGLLDTLEWHAGTHYIDLGTGDDKFSRQLMVHVVDPIRISARAGETSFALGKEPSDVNGFKTEVIVENLTDDVCLAAIEVVSAPFGWDAVSTGQPLLVLPPREKVACPIQVEVMALGGIRRDVGPVVVGARTLARRTKADGDNMDDAEILVTCELRGVIQADDQLFEAAEALAS